MGNIILKAENISKQYRLGLVGTGTLSHDLNRWWHTVRGKEDPYLKIGAVNDRSAKATADYVWALRDINFEVQEGEVLGIIGKNGAGKSTLLKILSRVTSPTTGTIKTKGRIASLLEVGTGFHPELTGRENIFLNGAILGMTKPEIRSKIDEIISFSGCEMYIDTPVKRYSSGMRVRLAFAVAAHLEPDILVVDEVLAVGDAEFQKKAIGKMQDISRGEGRTVLFVSHNMATIQSLCSRVIVVSNGFITFNGDTGEAIDTYIKDDSGQINTINNYQNRKGNGNLLVEKINLTSENGSLPKSGDNINFHFYIKSKLDTFFTDKIKLDFRIETITGQRLYWFSTSLKEYSEFVEKNTNCIIFNINNCPLNNGQYSITYNLSYMNDVCDWVENAVDFKIEEGDFFGNGKKVINLHSHTLLDFNLISN